jgi:hypothetical protein
MTRFGSPVPLVIQSLDFSGFDLVGETKTNFLIFQFPDQINGGAVFSGRSVTFGSLLDLLLN